MIATSGAVAAHQIPRMLLVARVAEFDAVRGYSLPPRAGGLGWGDHPGHSQVKTRSAVHARPTRIHVAVLPGKPDLANKARRWAIFVHGCFWRSHDNRALASKPGSNTDYWSDKLARNQARDAAQDCESWLVADEEAEGRNFPPCKALKSHKMGKESHRLARQERGLARHFQTIRQMDTAARPPP